MPRIGCERVFTRLLACALAVVMAVVVVPVGHTEGAVYYTGTVETTDAAGMPKDVFIRGEQVYANVGLCYMGLPLNDQIRVELQRASDGSVVSFFTAWTNNPETGWNNGSASGLSLSTGWWFSGTMTVYDVVVYDTGGGWWDEIARQPIIVKAEGLWIEPNSWVYSQEQVVAIRLVTAHTTEVFYVQVVDTMGATLANWTDLIAFDGTWETTWMIPPDFPDGNHAILVRDEATHAIWDSASLPVQKFLLALHTDRNYYLPGETADVTYAVIETRTLALYAGATLTYSAYWQNDTGAMCWLNGTLAGPEGVHSIVIPSDIALYSDMTVDYWANESSLWSYASTTWLYVGLMTAEVTLDESEYLPGDSVTVTVSSMVSFDFLPEAIVDVSISLDGVPIAEYGATGLVTDAHGIVSYRFGLNESAETGSYIVTVDVSKAGHSLRLMTVFNIYLYGVVLVDFDKDYYYSGDTAQIHVRVVWNNDVLAGQTVTYFILTDSGMFITGQNSTGVVEYLIPMDSLGALYIEVDTVYAGYLLSGFAMASVIPAEVSLDPEHWQYLPGEDVVFNYEIGTNLDDGQIEWTVEDADGVRVASGSLPFSKAGSFSYSVPSNWCSDSYTGTVVYETSSGYITEASATVDKAVLPPGMMSFLTVDTPTEGAVVDVPVIRVSGTTEPWMLLNVNGFAVLCGEDGTFDLNIPLLEGLNTVTVVTMGGMDQRTVTRNVTYDNPVPGLQSQMASVVSDLAAMAVDLASVWSDLNGIDLDLATVWDDLNETRSSVGSIWADVNASAASIATLQAQVYALRAELTDTHDMANGSDEELAAMNSALDSVQSQLDSASASLNATMADLAAAQDQLDSLQTDLDDVQDDVGAKATKSSITIWFAIAVLVSVVLFAGLFMLLRRKG